MCPSEHYAKCPFEHEAGIETKLLFLDKVPPLQIALKPTHTRKANIMGP